MPSITQTEAQQIRIHEIERYANIASIEADEVDPGFLNVTLTNESADRLGIYEALTLSPDGTVGVYTTNHPTHYGTFNSLLSHESDNNQEETS